MPHLPGDTLPDSTLLLPKESYRFIRNRCEAHQHRKGMFLQLLGLDKIEGLMALD